MDSDDDGLVTHEEAKQWNLEMREKHKAERKAARKARKNNMSKQAEELKD